MGKLEDALDRMGAAIARRTPDREPVVNRDRTRPRLTDLGTECQATQYSDQMYCRVCNLSYDVNDPDPPVCPVTSAEARSAGGPGRK